MLDHEFMIFHLGDSYFFMNELIKTQPTSQEESDLYNAIIKVRNLISEMTLIGKQTW